MLFFFFLEIISTYSAGIPCFQWNLKVVNGSKTNNYDMFVSQADGKTPIQFRFLGYDFVFGSHFDTYILDYGKFTPSVDSSQFQLPPLCSNKKLLREGTHLNMLKGVSMFAQVMPCEDSHADCHFNKFIHTHGKHYTSDDFSKRQSNFHSNFKFISEHNAKKDATFKMAINKFADLSINEYRKRVLMPKGMDRSRKGAHEKDFVSVFKNSEDAAANLPASIDWRLKGAVSQVKDQADCGSCWTFSTTGTLEGANFLATGKMIEFSEQQVCSSLFLLRLYIFI